MAERWEKISRLLENQVLIRYDVPEEEQIQGSALFKPAIRNEIKFKGTVLAVGPGRRFLAQDSCGCHRRPAEWMRRPMCVEPGQRVIFELGAGTLQPDYFGKNLLICEDQQITAILGSEEVCVLGESDPKKFHAVRPYGHPDAPG